MNKVKHIKLRHELPIGTRFTLDTWPDKTFEVVEAERYLHCYECFFFGGRLVKDGFFEDCGTFLLCNGNDRKDRTYVVFEEVEE